MVLVNAKGWKVVPLNTTDEAFPKLGMFSAPVIMRVSLSEMRLDEA